MENKLLTLSTSFAVEIINLVKELQESKEFIISNQIGRSGTSIGANISEAQYAQSKADFFSKLKIALKEANETIYWLTLLLKTNYISSNRFERLNSQCLKLRVTLIKSCNTTRNQEE